MINNPPRIDLNMDFEAYVDGLRETVPVKIQEVLENMDRLHEEYTTRKKAVKALRARGEIDEVGIYFWLLYAELEFSEYFVLQKWLIYWLNLFEKVSEYTIEKPFLKKNRFSDHELYYIKQKPIENFYPGELKGNIRLCGLCPFHEERTPSFFIFTNNNTYHCFGCHLGGDVISFIMSLKNISFEEAIEFLK